MISWQRRLTIALVAVAGAAVLLHGQISSSLVLRGDDFAMRGDVSRAMTMYRRALSWDRANETAADRLSFDEATSHEPPLVHDAIGVATRFLRRQPRNVALLLDRALANQIARRYAAASDDFTAASAIVPSARTLTFAGFAALHAGNRRRARELFVRAAQLDETFVPARHGLAQL